jgi:hypothetical protein
MSAAETLKTPSAVTPGTFRHNVLQAARRFKASWAEMGKLLVQVKDEGKAEEWGYESFDDYVKKELHIRPTTALKLLRAFNFVKTHEPKIVESEDFPTRAPAFEVVEVLAEAQERKQLSPSEYQSIRESIWDADKSTAELRRELTDRFPRPAAPADFSMRRFAQVARKLANDMSATKSVPKAVAERAGALADDLEELAASKSER